MDWFGLVRADLKKVSVIDGFPVYTPGTDAEQGLTDESGGAQRSEYEEPGSIAGKIYKITVMPVLYNVKVNYPGQPAEQRGTVYDYDQVRDYVPGDPMQMIHWKLSAKKDEILVKEGRYSDSKGIHLLLETSVHSLSAAGQHNPLSGKYDDIDRALAAFLSCSLELIRSGQAHNVCWFDHRKQHLYREEIAEESAFRRMESEVLDSAFAANAPGGDRGRFSVSFSCDGLIIYR